MNVVSEISVVKVREIGNGEGRNSKVFLAEDGQLGGQVAVKEIPVGEFKSPDDYFREAQHLYKTKHPRVTPIQYACRDADTIRLVMPYYSRGSLQAHLTAEGPPTIRQALQWAMEFLSGLHHIHISGLIHFDVKPTNLLLADDGSAMVADFGQARPVNAFGLANLPPMYIPHYPPEAIGQTVATKQADIYQCGLTLYRLINGNEILKSQTPSTTFELGRAIRAGKFPNRQIFLPHVPQRLRTILRKAMSVDPVKRYQTCQELTIALGQVDSLLDWKYRSTPNGAEWIRKSDGQVSRILLDRTNVQWHVEGTTQAPGKAPRRRNKWCAGPYPSRRDAEKRIAEIFAEDG